MADLAEIARQLIAEAVDVPVTLARDATRCPSFAYDLQVIGRILGPAPDGLRPFSVGDQIAWRT